MTQRFSCPAELLVEKNIFRQSGRTPRRLPNFEEVRPRLPVPVLPDDPGWINLYWSAWESFWKGLREPAEGLPLIAGYNQPSADRKINMGRSALIANLSGYIPGSFSLIEFLDNFYANQHDDGFICREIVPEDGSDLHLPFEPNSTGPNLLAWTEWRHFRLTGDRERIATVFYPLMAYHRWCRANRTWRSGLYWTTAYASGLINQPRVPGGRYHHSHWAWIDASAQASINCTMLERMAILLDEKELADEVAAERDRLIRAINVEMWNDEQNFYQDIGPDDRFSAVKSIAGYWTLLDAKLVPKERLALFVQHLRDTWSFRTDYVLPSLAADSEAYNARTGNGWRGAVWPSLTYMVLRGLNTADQHGLAHKLALNHVDMVGQVYDSTEKFWENYLPEKLGPAEPLIEDVSGITPSAIIPMILENVLGLTVDWPLRQVVWRRNLERQQQYGVVNLPLGNEGTIDLLGDAETIRVRSDAPITLIVYEDNEILQTAVPAGMFDLSFK